MSTLNASSFSQLVGSIYAAAADPQKWPLFLDQFARLMRSEGTILFMHDFADSRFVADGIPGVVAEVTGFDPAFVDSYASHYSSKNVWTAREESMAPGTAVVSEMLVSERELVRTEFYGDWLHPQGLRHAIGGVVLKTGTQAMKFTSLRSSREGAFCRAELAFYAALMPHLQQACKINQQFAALRQANAAQTSAIDALPMAVWLCKQDLSVLTCNRAAQAVLDQKRGLRLDVAGRLHTESSGEDGSLRRALTHACSGRNLKLKSVATASAGISEREGCSLSVSRAISPTKLAVSVSPLDRETPICGIVEHEADVVVFASDPDLKRPSDATMHALQSAYRLTKHQSRLAEALIGGSDLRTYAVRHSISYETARSHLKQIMAKTGTSKQADLVRLFFAGSSKVN